MKSDWLFFDVGSTLVDETQAYEHRIRDAIEGTDITFEQFMEKREFFARQNLRGVLEAIKFFGLKLTPWHKEDEVLYPTTARCRRCSPKGVTRTSRQPSEHIDTREGAGISAW